ncbi:hypothetical protein NDU88_006094 [Pleurodeles waltl]|uniref:Uncharacterized protein n=1 Tax=Pleurodeles waltl TaxID=8319 RepID=A0AAV7QK74_PLEWA|nr:hypothetical protein NDU88_006094 [Pleurodeles waltl]
MRSPLVCAICAPSGDRPSPHNALGRKPTLWKNTERNAKNVRAFFASTTQGNMSRMRRMFLAQATETETLSTQQHQAIPDPSKKREGART